MNEPLFILDVLQEYQFDPAVLDVEQDRLLFALRRATKYGSDPNELVRAWNDYHAASRSYLAKLTTDDESVSEVLRYLDLALLWQRAGDLHRSQRNALRAQTIAKANRFDWIRSQIEPFIDPCLRGGLKLEIAESYERAVVAYEESLRSDRCAAVIPNQAWLHFAIASCCYHLAAANRQTALGLTAPARTHLNRANELFSNLAWKSAGDRLRVKLDRLSVQAAP
ncbi:hypothetical protein HJC99_05190 [Candidatus Saccharibacteria bacterium]|nr:hypothetical protein [Candidatus Saccharibacteria bacterium]